MKIPKKPEALEDQVSMIWDFVFNHVFTAQHWQGVMLKFVLALLGVIIGLWAVSIIMGG